MILSNEEILFVSTYFLEEVYKLQYKTYDGEINNILKKANDDDINSIKPYLNVDDRLILDDLFNKAQNEKLEDDISEYQTKKRKKRKDFNKFLCNYQNGECNKKVKSGQISEIQNTDDIVKIVIKDSQELVNKKCINDEPHLNELISSDTSTPEFTNSSGKYTPDAENFIIEKDISYKANIAAKKTELLGAMMNIIQMYCNDNNSSNNSELPNNTLSDLKNLNVTSMIENLTENQINDGSASTILLQRITEELQKKYRAK